MNFPSTLFLFLYVFPFFLSSSSSSFSLQGYRLFCSFLHPTFMVCFNHDDDEDDDVKQWESTIKKTTTVVPLRLTREKNREKLSMSLMLLLLHPSLYIYVYSWWCWWRKCVVYLVYLSLALHSVLLLYPFFFSSSYITIQQPLAYCSE